MARPRERYFVLEVLVRHLAGHGGGRTFASNKPGQVKGATDGRRIRLRHTGGLLRYRDLQSEEQDWTAEGRPGWSDRVHCIASGGALGGVKNRAFCSKRQQVRMR